MLHKTLSDCASSQSVVGGGEGSESDHYLLGWPLLLLLPLQTQWGGREGGTGVVVCILGRRWKVSVLNGP